jgi:uncharacterized protein YjbI with pentapeptide repeats
MSARLTDIEKAIRLLEGILHAGQLRTLAVLPAADLHGAVLAAMERSGVELEAAD